MRSRHINSGWGRGQKGGVKVAILWEQGTMGETVQQPLHGHYMGSGEKNTCLGSTLELFKLDLILAKEAKLDRKGPFE